MRRRRRPAQCPLPLVACIVAYATAFPLLFIDPLLSAIPLGLFLVICLAAPFFPGWSFYVPVISRGRSGRHAVAITFDDGPDPVTTPALLDLLHLHGAVATFFVTGVKTSAHRDLVRRILSGGHSIGNHSYHHSPLLMLRSSSHLLYEVKSAQELLSEFGITPLAFRPPVGITGPRLGPALKETGMLCVNFSCRGHDAGNRFINRLSHKILKKVKADDIILLHDSAPGTGFNVSIFLREIELILVGLKTKGLEVLPLAEITDKNLMKKQT